MKYMLDTNICIYAIKKKPESVLKRLRSVAPSDVCVSAVTYAELMYGVEKSAAVEKNRLALTMLLSNIEILPFDTTAAMQYGRVRAELEKRGTPIGPLDTMIAGHAEAVGYTLVTNNAGEFARVTGLSVENWAEEGL